MGAKRVFRFSYYAELQSNDPQLPHKQRDGDAFIELMDALRGRDYRYGELILNPPRRPSEPDVVTDLSLTFSTDDLIVLTTRPPLDELSRRRIMRSRTALERKVLDVVARYFSTCAVDKVILEPKIADALTDEDLRSRSEVEFWTNQSTLHERSAYKAYRVAHSRVPLTAVDRDTTPHTMAYLLFLESEAWRDGPGLLCSFSAGGTQTLVWNHWLRHRPKLRPLILDQGSRIVLADITMDPAVSGCWIDLCPADAWNVRCEAVPLTRGPSGGWGPDTGCSHMILDTTTT